MSILINVDSKIKESLYKQVVQQIIDLVSSGALNPGGMDLNALEQVCEKESPAFIYTIPNFHNPTGITTDQKHREKLIHICENYRVPLAEDGFEEEMKYFGRVALPVKSIDRRGVVIYLGTFSKILFPGLRIGWIAADRECIQRLVPVQRSTVLAGNHLDQAALEMFCRAGFYDMHVKKMHRTYRKRMNTAITAIKTYFPGDNVSWTVPAGGYVIWVRRTEKNQSETEIISRIKRAGVAVTPGRFHFFGAALSS